MPKVLNQYVLDRLCAHANPDDIALELCQNHNLSWPEAEVLIESIKLEHSKTIHRRRAPLLIILSLGTFLIGSGLAIYSAFELSEVIRASSLKGIQGSINILAYLLQVGEIHLFVGFLGGGMVTGSLVGAHRIWSSIFIGE